jgi:hypothetical protein
VQAYSRDEFEKIWNGEVLTVFWEDKLPEREVDPNAPRIRFERTFQDFGLVSQGEKVRRAYIFRNEGNSPLVIEKVASSCGCTALVVSATEIEAGAEGIIRAELDTSGRRGRETQYVSLFTNDPNSPETHLTLSGIVKVELDYNPKRVYFGQLAKGESVEREVILTDTGEGNLDITSLESDNPRIALSQEPFEDERIKDNLKRFRLRVRLSANEMDLGNFASTITILTSVPVKSRIEIPVEGEIVTDLVVRPSCLNFGFTEVGDTVTRSVTITKRDSSAFTVERVDASGLAEVAVVKELERSEYRLDAILKARDRGRIRDWVCVEITGADEKQVKIPVFALVQ